MRIFFLFYLSFLFLFSYYDKVLIDVNGEAITKLDIQNTAKKFKLSKEGSINKAIIDVVQKQEAKNRNIEISQLELDGYMKKIAKNNKISILELKNKISKDMNLDIFMKDIQNKLKQEKLNMEILKEKRFFIDEKSIQDFYKKNIDYYSDYSSIQVKEYISRDLNVLKNIKNNPLMINKLVQIKDIKINLNKINDQDIKQELLKTKKEKFSKIIAKNDIYIMFYILNKRKNGAIPFERVKNSIHSRLYQEKSQKVIVNYFQRKKLQADIEFTDKQ